MNIKLYRSATVGIYLNGKKILCDPWLVDGEYLGSWSHYPYYDLDANLAEIYMQAFVICIARFKIKLSQFCY